MNDRRRKQLSSKDVFHEEFEVPTNKADLIDWLNLNFNIEDGV